MDAKIVEIPSVEEIKTKLGTNRAWAERAIVVLFSHQTNAEQYMEETHELNSKGFNAFDAEILSSFAKWLLRGGHLSQKQLAIAFKKLPKYHKQIRQEIILKANQ